MKKGIINLVILLFGISTISCTSILSTIYGMSNNVVQLNKEEIIHFAEKFNIKSDNLYELDSTYYDFLISINKNSNNSDIVHNHEQPFQAMYFDKNGKLISYFIGCYANMGFPNINWNANKEFEKFPPNQQSGLSPDTLFNYFKINEFFEKISKNENLNEQLIDYYFVVFWITSGGRQSKRFLDIVQKNLKLTDVNVKSLFVNVDNYYIYEYKKNLAIQKK